ncbi:capsule biosynthesis protein [Falsigemmobacter faecalis]|uniref:Capsule biosynthesis protein n=1 Tax=Falsigemmobacter faecalis TaxID=2488730 RepID=A0A3P3DS49_9RHOB|nr:capsule biosynthesis protein [Falsigemmobacter faecalis]RRH76372.1 capsule biosynthesis protein [Falsigemmobacter faecalis]
MTTQSELPRFRLTLPEPLAALRAAAAAPVRPPKAALTGELLGDEAARPTPPPATEPAPETTGLGPRQLRMLRRIAEKQGLTTSGDEDALRQLRAAGIDPFARSNAIEEVVTPRASPPDAPPPVPPKKDGRPGEGAKLPATAKGRNLAKAAGPDLLLPPEARAQQNHAADIQRIQRDIARRRRRRMAMLWARLWLFVGIPTLIAGIYYSLLATPMYATRAEFVIQQAESQVGGGLGGLFSGTQFATSQDSIAVQGYLQSRDAMLRLDADLDFRAVFADPNVDELQRLDDPNSIEAAYKIYQKYVKIAYDPTEGIIKMEVSAPDPALSAAWSKRLIHYAEEQVNHLSERLRNDQMKGANESFAEAESRLLAAQSKLVDLQEVNKVLSGEVEISLISSQITALETQLTQDRLALAQMLSNTAPNRARVEPLERRITTLEVQIRQLRDRLTQDDSSSGRSIARIQSELVLAQTDVQTRQLLLTQAAQQLETARIEANRQQRYLSLSVAPVAPDIASYPRAFENTAVAMLIFAGLYLMVSLTASILREQV